MKLKILGISLIVSYPAVAFLTLALICDKKGTVLLCFLSSILHELGHILAMKLQGAKFKSIAFNLGDVAIKADSSSLSYNAEIIVSISGVAVNFLIALLSFVLWLVGGFDLTSDLALTNLCIGVFNILPVRFLDGGQVLLLILSKKLSPKTTNTLIDVLTVIFLVPIGAFGLIFLFNSSYNYSLLFAALYLICTLVSKELR